MVLDGKISEKEGYSELLKVGNRGYTTGFFLGKNDETSYSYDISKGLAGADFLGIVQDVCKNLYKVLIKNKININDEIEIITPNFSTFAKVTKILNPKRETNDVANTNDEVLIEFETKDKSWEKEWDYALLRTVGIKNKVWGKRWELNLIIILSLYMTLIKPN